MSDVPGSSDCEARAAAIQPALFTTSWSYVLVGLALAWWVWSRRDVSRLWGGLFALGMVTTGLGSVDYHGAVVAPQPLVHDFGLAIALLVALGFDLSRLTGRDRGAGLVAVIAGAFSLLVVWVWPAASPSLAAVIGLGLVVAEVLVYRRGLRRWGWSQTAAASTLVLGVVAFALSRTGGPLCDPESWIQGHGVWHMLSAAALGFWALGAFPGSATGQARESTAAGSGTHGVDATAGEGHDVVEGRRQ